MRYTDSLVWTGNNMTKEVHDESDHIGYTVTYTYDAQPYVYSDMKTMMLQGYLVEGALSANNVTKAEKVAASGNEPSKVNTYQMEYNTDNRVTKIMSDVQFGNGRIKKDTTVLVYGRK